jgi:hypothetical protein
VDKLVMLGIVGVAVAKRRRELVYRWLIRSDELGGAAERDIAAEMISSHPNGIFCAVLWVEADDYEPKLLARPQARLFERGRNKGDNRTAQCCAGVVSKYQHRRSHNEIAKDAALTVLVGDCCIERDGGIGRQQNSGIAIVLWRNTLNGRRHSERQCRNDKTVPDEA